MSRPSQCQRDRGLGQHGTPVMRSSARPAAVLRFHRNRRTRSRPFSGSGPPRRLSDSSLGRCLRRVGRDRNPWGLAFDSEDSGAQ